MLDPTWSLVVSSTITASGFLFGGAAVAWGRGKSAINAKQQEDVDIPQPSKNHANYAAFLTTALSDVLFPPKPPAPTMNTEN